MVIGYKVLTSIYKLVINTVDMHEILGTVQF